MTIGPHSVFADELFANGGRMGALMRDLDWSKTPLGLIETWPQSLKTSLSICLHSRFAILIWWGPELVKLYNDAYVQLIGKKHPGALGAPGREVWPEIWDTIGPMLNGVLDRGEASWSEDLLLLLERNGYAEECYFTFSYSPIRDESGGVGGVFTPVMETTEKVISRRRQQTLRELAVVGGKSKNIMKACATGATVLSANPYDLPMAAIYLFDGGHRNRAVLAASAGSESAGALKFPQTVDLSRQEWPSCSRVADGETCTVDLTTAQLISPTEEPWGAAPVQAVLVPIAPLDAPAPVGFLFAGVSVRKRLDEEYREFYSQVATRLAAAFRESEMLQRERALRAEAEAERRKISELFLNAPVAIAILRGPEHRYTLVNGRYLELVGRESPDELIGKTVLEILPEIEDQGIVEILNKVYKTGIPYVGNELLVRLKHTAAASLDDVYFNFVYQPTRNVEGHIEGILALVIDVTEQVVSRREVEMREEQFRVLADSIPQLAWMANADGSIFWFNRRWYEYTGTKIDRMSGWGWQSVHDPKLLPRMLVRYKHSMETGEQFEMVCPLRRADGTFRSFLTLASPVRDTNGTIVRWFGTNTDVEGQQRAEAALRQSEKLAAVGRLASSIAHEINNPLEAVTNLIYLARSAAIHPDAQRYLDSAEQELGRVSQITSQTLRFHKQQSAAAPTDIPELLESVLALYRGKLSRDGIKLDLNVAKCPALVCYAGEIRQVLANLVGNALDAMPRGGTLSLRVHSSENWRTHQPGLRFTVADTGHGMSSEVRKHIYEPFYTTKGEVGTGLGLWVSAGIVDKHGGSVHVRSSDRPGASWTVFTVILPHVNDANKEIVQ